MTKIKGAPAAKAEKKGEKPAKKAPKEEEPKPAEASAKNFSSFILSNQRIL